MSPGLCLLQYRHRPYGALTYASSAPISISWGIQQCMPLLLAVVSRMSWWLAKKPEYEQPRRLLEMSRQLLVSTNLTQQAMILTQAEAASACFPLHHALSMVEAIQLGQVLCLLISLVHLPQPAYAEC